MCSSVGYEESGIFLEVKGGLDDYIHEVQNNGCNVIFEAFIAVMFQVEVFGLCHCVVLW
jgi:hypothetical protein